MNHNSKKTRTESFSLEEECKSNKKFKKDGSSSGSTSRAPSATTMAASLSKNDSSANNIVTGPRKDALMWDDYFMSVAFLSSMRSKDPNTQVGACIVNKEKRIVGIGYNGFPRGCSDEELPWARHSESGNELETKYPYVCHAEVNAILNKNSADVQGCSLYVGLFPCNECAKMVIQSGIREVIFLSDKYKNSNSMIASRRLFNMANVKLRQHQPKEEQVVIKFPQSQA